MNQNPTALEECPSDLRLDIYCAGESLATEQEALRLHIERCPRCQAEVELRQAGFAAFHGTQQAYLARFRNRLDEHEKSRPAPGKSSSFKKDRSSWLFGWKAAACALVTAGVVLLVTTRPDSPPQQRSPQQAQIRVKGGQSLKVFVSRDGHVEQASDGSELQEGDKLRFRLSLSGPGNIMLLGREANNTLYPIATSPEKASMFMSAGIDQTLEQTVELDASQGKEALHLLSCPSPFSFDQVVISGNELDFPQDCIVSSMYFKKVPAKTP